MFNPSKFRGNLVSECVLQLKWRGQQIYFLLLINNK